MQAITPFDRFTYPYILSQVFLFSVTENERGKKRGSLCVRVCVFGRLDQFQA